MAKVHITETAYDEDQMTQILQETREAIEKAWAQDKDPDVTVDIEWEGEL